MNIWILNHYAVTRDLPGGTRHFDFAEELTRRGYKVTVFCSSFHFGLRKEVKFSPQEKKIFKEEEHDGVKFVWIKTFPYKGNDLRRVINMFSYAYRVLRIGKSKKLERPDVIIGSSVHLLAVFSAYLLSKYHKTHFIMEVRDLWPQTLVDMGLSRWHPLVLLLRILETFLYRKAEKIIVLLPKADEYIKSLRIPGEKIVWIPNGVNLCRFRKSKKRGNGNDGFVVMYMGVMGRANNIDVILEAAQKLKKYKEIRFLLVGDGPEKARLKKFSEEIRLNNVSFEDAVPKEKVPLYLQDADVLIFNLIDAPVFRFGISPNKLFDYMASGNPIIFASNAVNNPVEEAKAGITVKPLPNTLASAILELYRISEDERIKMGRRGFEYVKKYHNIPVLVDRLEKVLKDVISQREFSFFEKRTWVNRLSPQVTPLTAKDTRVVADLHKSTIPGFLSTLGSPFLTILYEKMAKDPNSFVLLAKSEGRIEGFVSGSVNVRKFYKRFLINSFFQVFITLIPQFLNPSVWKKIVETLRYPLKNGDLPQAELLSIAISKKARGKGVAVRLFDSFKEEMERRRVKQFKVTVGSENLIANRFYKKVGFKLIAQREVHAGEKSNVWVYSLEGGG